MPHSTGRQSLEMQSLSNTSDQGQAQNILLPKPFSRSSFNHDYYRQHACHITIWDEQATDLGGGEYSGIDCSRHTIPDGPGSSFLSQNLKDGIQNRTPSRTRWINIVGWNDTLMNYLSESCLDNHTCLDLSSASTHMLGGPVSGSNDDEFFWIQTSIWFLGNRNPDWSFIQQSDLRMVVCMPTSSRAGTLITNFVGDFSLAKEISAICSDQVIENHSLGREALGCVWILSFSILKKIAEQVDFAFQTLDPMAATDTPSIPRIDDLPYMLERANNLARIDRYISGLEEFASFFDAVRSFQHKTAVTSNTANEQRYNCPSVRARATLESSLAQQKINRAQKLCKTYLRQYESLVQMTISYGTSQITERLDSGRRLTERVATMGIILAGVSAVISPLTLVVGYFGMNVREMVDGAGMSLFDFWQIAVPCLLICFVGLGSIILRFLTQQASPQR